MSNIFSLWMQVWTFTLNKILNPKNLVKKTFDLFYKFPRSDKSSEKYRPTQVRTLRTVGRFRPLTIVAIISKYIQRVLKFVS